MPETLQQLVAKLSPDEKQRLRERMLKEENPVDVPETALRPRYTIFFPEDTGLHSLELRGQIPNRGDNISFRSHGFDLDPAYSFQDCKRWYVKSVWYSVTVEGHLHKRLIQDDYVSAEIQVDWRRWAYRLFQLKCKWSAAKRWLRKKLTGKPY